MNNKEANKMKMERCVRYILILTILAVLTFSIYPVSAKFIVKSGVQPPKEVNFHWITVDPYSAYSASEGDEITDYGNYTIQDDDGYFIYKLPFTFNFMGRKIVNISVNTNGLIELLEKGEDPYEDDDYDTHGDGDYIGTMDAIFASNDDLVTESTSDDYLGVFNLGDRVVIEWYGCTYDDWDTWYGYTSDDYPVHFQVVLHKNGTVEWNFKTMGFEDYDADMYSGAYAMEENRSFDVGYAIDYQTSFVANFAYKVVPHAIPSKIPSGYFTAEQIGIRKRVPLNETASFEIKVRNLDDTENRLKFSYSIDPATPGNLTINGPSSVTLDPMESKKIDVGVTPEEVGSYIVHVVVTTEGSSHMKYDFVFVIDAFKGE